MLRSIYLETSIVSYLAARPSKSIIGAAHQQLTLAWWEQRARYRLFVSQSVWQECAAGDPIAAEKRLAVLEGIPLLEINQAMVDLAGALIDGGILPAKAIEDALHISVATWHGMDLLLTWNCRHIANPFTQEKIAELLDRHGLYLPMICTPEELLGGNDHD